MKQALFERQARRKPGQPETNMKTTGQDFDNAIADFGFEIAAEALKKAIAAYLFNWLAGFDQATCEAEEATAWYAHLNEGSTNE